MPRKVKSYKVAVATNRPNHYSENGFDVYPLSENGSNYNDVIIMRTAEYETIFGKKRRSTSRKKKRLSVVKIVSESGEVIYRRFLGSGTIPKDTIALSVNSILMLSDSGIVSFKKDLPSRVVGLSEGNYFMYYWTHSFHATRISYRFGLISLILSILSIILAIVLKYC